MAKNRVKKKNLICYLYLNAKIILLSEVLEFLIINSYIILYLTFFTLQIKYF